MTPAPHTILCITDNIYYMFIDLRDVTREASLADRLRSRADAMLAKTVRDAARAGFSQREIAAATGRSQPEISRLIRFRGTSPHGKKLRSSRQAVLNIAREYGLEDIEVFGSVARGTDNQESDIDLLYTSRKEQTLFTVAAAEAAMANVLGVNVDLVDRNSLKPNVESQARQEAIPL